MQAITKIFNNEQIRTVWDEEEEKYFISVVEVVGVLTNNDNKCARNYCKVLKFRLKEEGNETVENCNQLKLKTEDDLKQKIGKTVVSNDNKLNYQHIEDNKKKKLFI